MTLPTMSVIETGPNFRLSLASCNTQIVNHVANVILHPYHCVHNLKVKLFKTLSAEFLQILDPHHCVHNLKAKLFLKH
jgi:hypothetical protein